jgi:hypothetical protein
MYVKHYQESSPLFFVIVFWQHGIIYHMAKKIKKGALLIPKGLPPLENHEEETIDFLRNFGHDIEFLLPKQEKGARTPDIKMGGEFWEIKTIFGNNKHTIQQVLKRARKQSNKILLDLRKTKLPQQEIIRVLKKEKKMRKNLIKIKAITNDDALIDI